MSVINLIVVYIMNIFKSIILMIRIFLLIKENWVKLLDKLRWILRLTLSKFLNRFKVIEVKIGRFCELVLLWLFLAFFLNFLKIGIFLYKYNINIIILVYIIGWWIIKIFVIPYHIKFITKQ